MTGLAPDLDEARRFLTLLDDGAQWFTFQTATDAEPKPKPDHRAKTINLPPDNLKALAVRNGDGAAVWVMINEGNGEERRAENVTSVRAVFGDLDGAPLDPMMRYTLPPHCIVESSPGRFHAYWLVEDLPLDQFAAVQKAIAARFNGDPSVHDLPRVMRVPGFMHQKGEPFLSRIVHEHVGQPYQAAQILEAFPPVREEERRREPRGNGGHSDSPFVTINDAALADLAAWVPVLFPTARQSSKRWRVSSADLGRGLEEDLSITPQGAKYFGVHDMGDPRKGRRTPIDLVMEYGGARHATAAAEWLADKLGVEFKATAAPDHDEEQAAKPQSDYDAAVARLAQLKPHEYDAVRKDEAKRLGVRVGTLDHACATFRNRRSKGRSQQSNQEIQAHSFDHDFDHPRSKGRSQEIAVATNVLELVADAIEQLGAAGVRREAQILYLAITTRLLSYPFRPAHVLVKGASAGGKNYLVDAVAQLMPESAIYKMTGMSDRALAYLTEPMAHRFIILAEAAAIEDSEVALALVRSLLSEGEIRYPTVEKDEAGKLAATLKHLEGPTGLIMTTTSPRIHTENETRHLSINIKDDWTQTQIILREQAKLAAGKDIGHVDLEPWHDFQRSLEGQERRVVVPFAATVAELVVAGPVRLRRDFPRFIALIMAHALLHQENRERDGEGRIVASLQDYDAVHRLVARDFAETAELAHPQSIVEVVEGVRELQLDRPDGVTIHAMIEHAKANAWGSTDRDMLSRRCRSAIGRGLMVNLETRRRQPARYKLTAAACEEIGLFPEARQVIDKFGGFATFDPSTTAGRRTGRSQDLDEQGVSAAFDSSTSETGPLGEAHELLSLDDLDRMGGEGDGWAEVDAWNKP